MDIKGVRIYGLPYLGAGTRTVLAELPTALRRQSLEGIGFTALMAHFGLEGEIPGVPGGVPRSQVAPLRGAVDYLALGHWHKPFEGEGWIYNPGSLETCAAHEYRWNGGFYHVEVDTERSPKHRATHVKGHRRPFYRLAFPVDEYLTPDALYEGLRKRVEQDRGTAPPGYLAPVAEVSLEGVLAFDRSAVDMEYVRELILDICSPLIARPKNNTRAAEFEVSSGERLSRPELERQVMEDLIQRDSRYRRQIRLWASLAQEVKTMALTGSAPEAILAAMRGRIEDADGEWPSC